MISRKTRIGAAAAVVGVLAAVAVTAAVLILPDYVTTFANVEHDIEEWSAPPPAGWITLSPKGLAATVLEPNEVLGGGEQGAFRRLNDAR